MAAEKRRPDDDPHDSMIDEVAERVFINYEPPQQEDRDQEEDGEETQKNQPAA